MKEKEISKEYIHIITYVRFKRNKSPMMADDEARRDSPKNGPKRANDFFPFILFRRFFSSFFISSNIKHIT